MDRLDGGSYSCRICGFSHGSEGCDDNLKNPGSLQRVQMAIEKVEEVSKDILLNKNDREVISSCVADIFRRGNIPKEKIYSDNKSGYNPLSGIGFVYNELESTFEVVSLTMEQSDKIINALNNLKKALLLS